MRFCPFCSAENADELAACQACGRRLPPLPPRRARNAPPTGVQLPPRPPSTTQPPVPRRSGTTLPPVIAAAAPNPVPTPQAPPDGAVRAIPDGPKTAPLVAPTPTGLFAMKAPIASASDTFPSAHGLEDAATSLDAPLVVPPGPESAQTNAVQPIGSAYELPAASQTMQLAGGDRDSVPVLPPPPTQTPARPPPTVTQVQADDAARRSLLGAITPGPAALRREPLAIPRVAQTQGAAGGAEPARRRSDAPSIPPPLAAPPLVEPPTKQYPFSAPRELVIEDAPTNARISSTPMQGASAQPPPTPSRGSRPPTMPPPTPVTQPRPSAPIIAAEWRRGSASASEGPLASSGAEWRRGSIEPPVTRIQRGEANVERPFTPPRISPVPEIPEPGLVNAARYAARFARARYQRRGAIKALGIEIKQDTEALDQVLGALGREARTRKVEGRVFSAENTAITAAEERIAQLGREHAEVDARRADENSKFADVERERTTKLSEAERGVEEAQRELLVLEGQRRGLRDRRKDLERRQKAHLKSAEDQDRQAGAAQMGDQRSELRRAGESHRREAAALEPERQDCDRQLAAIERPIVEATARQDAAKAELDAAKRSLADAREGHTHRLAELDAEAKRKTREIALAEGEIARRLVTLGTLVNLNRIDDAAFAELYLRIDRLRGAITARTTEIEKLTAERDAYDRGMLVRGVSVIGGAFVLLIALIVILRAVI